uniref:Uncharacterized protein n=1 Tax=Heterorhabditis bacteriophora TaxID=37862 RepID=A0A1I7X5L6_HETBA
MEPPAVTTCNSQASIGSSSNGLFHLFICSQFFFLLKGRFLLFFNVNI